MVDRLGRHITYLRISVTDRCNLRCVYCMPEDGVELLPHSEILRYEEILDLAQAARDLGITQVRVTGGEPLVRRNLPSFIAGLKDLGFEDISLTTNGILLPTFAEPLKKAGLDRVNISIDSLDPAVFRSLTRIGELDQVIAGIQAALAAGLHPVKLNTVVVAGINEDQVEALAQWTEKDPVHVRFIELMPIGTEGEEDLGGIVSARQILDRIETLGKLTPAEVKGAGPAQVYKLPNAKGTIGIISAMTQPFCSTCNRLRLTADGKIRPCLGSDMEFDAKEILRSEKDPKKLQDKLKALLTQAIMSKPDHHNLLLHPGSARRMCQIGG